MSNGRRFLSFGNRFRILAANPRLISNEITVYQFHNDEFSQKKTTRLTISFTERTEDDFQFLFFNK